MSDPVVDKIQSHPKYLELRKKRGGFGWLLEALGNAGVGLVAGAVVLAAWTGIQRIRS